MDKEMDHEMYVAGCHLANQLIGVVNQLIVARMIDNPGAMTAICMTAVSVYTATVQEECLSKEHFLEGMKFVYELYERQRAEGAVNSPKPAGTN